MKRAVTGYRRRRPRELTMEQVLHAVKFPTSGKREVKTADVAEQCDLARSTYILDILKELYCNDLVNLREAVNSRGNIVYMWSVSQSQLEQMSLPF